MQNTLEEKKRKEKQRNAIMLILKVLKFILVARIVSSKSFAIELLSIPKFVRTLASILLPDSFYFVQKYCAGHF